MPSFTTRPLQLFTLAIGITLASAETRAQSTDKWLGTIGQLSISGAVDFTAEARNEKQSKVKLVFRNTRRETRLAWDIVEGRCRDEGKTIAPQATFTPLITTMDGGGSATANVPKLVVGKLYYVRVFDPEKASTDATAYGCANISEKP